MSLPPTCSDSHTKPRLKYSNVSPNLLLATLQVTCCWQGISVWGVLRRMTDEAQPYCTLLLVHPQER